MQAKAKKSSSILKFSDKLLKANKDSYKRNTLKSTQSIFYQIHSFYVTQTIQVLKSYQRGYIFSLFLLVIYSIQLLSLVFSPPIISELTKNSFNSADSIKTISKYINYFKIFPCFGYFYSNAYDTADSKQTTFNAERVFLIVAGLWNCLLIISLILRLGYYLGFQFKQNQLYCQDDPFFNQTFSKQGSNQNIERVNQSLSFLLRVYIHLFLIPFCEISLKIAFLSDYSTNRSTFDVLLGCFTGITTILIGIFISLHESDFSLIIRDHLSQQSTRFVLFSLFCDILSCFFLLSNQVKIQEIYQMVNIILRLSVLLKELPFNNLKLQRLMIQFLSFILLFLVSCIISSGSSSSKLSFSVLAIIQIPLSFQIGIWLDSTATSLSSYKQPFLEEEISKISIIKLHRYIKNSIPLFAMPIEAYMQNGQGIIFETIFANHCLTCSEQVAKKTTSIVQYTQGSDDYEMNKFNQIGFNCFCNKFRNQSSFKQSKESSYSQNKTQMGIDNGRSQISKHNKSFIQTPISHLTPKQPSSSYVKLDEFDGELQKKFSEMFGENYRRSFSAQYIGAILDQVQANSFNKESHQKLQIIYTQAYFLLQIAQTPVKAFKLILMLKDQMKQASFVSKAMLQGIITEIQDTFGAFIQQCPFQNQRLEISAVFTFDKLFTEFKVCLKEAIISKQRFFEFLCTDYISLSELLKQSQLSLSSKLLAESKIMELFDIHPTHSKTRNIAEIYVDLFDFRKRRVGQFISRSKQLTKRNLQQADLKIDLFESSTCAIFLSLHSHEITRVSDSAGSFFNLYENSKDLIGKPFISLLPEFLVQNFKKYVEGLLDEGNMDVIKIGEYFTYVRGGKGTNFINPVYLRAKVDIIGSGELGLSMFFASCSTRKVSLVSDDNYFLKSCTQSANNLFLRFIIKDRNYSPKNTEKASNLIDLKNGTNLKNLIPLLYSIGRNNEILNTNNFQGYNEKLGFKDQRIQKSEVYRTLLALPTKYEDLRILSNKRIPEDNPNDLSAFLCSYPQLELEFYEITFSIFASKLNQVVDKETRIIEIISSKHLSRAHEVNLLVSELKNSLEMYFQQPFELHPFFVNNNSMIKDKKYYALGTQKTNNSYELSEISNNPFNTKRENLSLNMLSGKEWKDEHATDAIIEGSHFHLNSDHQIINLSIRRKNTNSLDETTNGGFMFGNSTSRIRHLTGKEGGGDQEYAEEEAEEDDIVQKLFSKEDTKQQTTIVPLISPRAGHETSNHQLLSSSIDNNENNKALVSLTSPYPTTLPIQISTREIISTNFIMNSLEGQSSQKQGNQDYFVKTNVFDLPKNSHKIDSKYQQMSYFKRRTQNNNGQNESADTNESLEAQKGPDVCEITQKNHNHKSNQKNIRQKEDSFEVIRKQTAHEDQQSVRSTSSQLFSQRQSLFNAIVSKREPSEITLSKYVGIFAYMVIIIITCVLFFQVQSNFDIQWINYENLLIGPSLIESFAQILRIKEIQTLITVDGSYHYFTSTFSSILQTMYQTEALQRLDNMKLVLNTLEKDQMQYGFEAFMLNNTNITMTNRVNLVTLTTYQFPRLQNKKFSRKLRNIYCYFVIISLFCPPIFTREAMLTYPPNLFNYLVTSEVFTRRYVYVNYNMFLDTGKGLQNISMEQVSQKLDATKQLLYTSIIIIELISFLTVLIIFPIYYMIQNKRQEILNLLVTFNPQLLQQLIIKYKSASQLKIVQTNGNSLNEVEQLKYSANIVDQRIFLAKQRKNISQGKEPKQHHSQLRPSSYGPSSTTSKKRQISQTKQLPKFSLSLSLMTLLVFSIISLYGLLNFFLTKDFFEMFKYHIDELSFITYTKGLLALNYSGAYITVNTYVYKYTQSMIDNLLIFFTGSQFADNAARMIKWQSLSENFVKTRFQMENYYTYFLDIINQDACPMISSKYAVSRLQQNPLVDVSLCSTIDKGVLSQGLAVVFKHIYSTIFGMIDDYITLRGQQTAYFQSFHAWDIANNFKEFDLVYYYVRVILDSMTDFLIQQSRDYFDYLMTLQKVLFGYSLLSVSLIFLLLWRKFLEHMARSIAETTFLLSLMPIENLLENPYIMSYLNKQKSHLKRRQ